MSPQDTITAQTSSLALAAAEAKARDMRTDNIQTSLNLMDDLLNDGDSLSADDHLMYWCMQSELSKREGRASPPDSPRFEDGWLTSVSIMKGRVEFYLKSVTGRRLLLSFTPKDADFLGRSFCEMAKRCEK